MVKFLWMRCLERSLRIIFLKHFLLSFWFLRKFEVTTVTGISFSSNTSLGACGEISLSGLDHDNSILHNFFLKFFSRHRSFFRCLDRPSSLIKLFPSLLFSRNFAVAPSVALFSLTMHNDESPISMAEVLTELFCFLLPFFFLFDLFLCRFTLQLIFFFAIFQNVKFLTHTARLTFVLFWKLNCFIVQLGQN